MHPDPRARRFKERSSLALLSGHREWLPTNSFQMEFLTRTFRLIFLSESPRAKLNEQPYSGGCKLSTRAGNDGLSIVDAKRNFLDSSGHIMETKLSLMR